VPAPGRAGGGDGPLGAFGLGEALVLGFRGAPDHVEHGPELGPGDRCALVLRVEVGVLREGVGEALLDEALDCALAQVNAALSEQPRVMSASLENVPQRLRMAVAIANYVAESLPDRSSEAGGSQE